MKIDRHSSNSGHAPPFPTVDRLPPLVLPHFRKPLCFMPRSELHRRPERLASLGAAAILGCLWLSMTLVIAAAVTARAESGSEDAETNRRSDNAQRASDARRAKELAPALLDQALRQLVYGPSFDAKVRQRVWAAGREVIGVGSYEQAGHGSGQFNLQLTMHDGDGQHTLQQISDGKLAWTRAAVADDVTLKRVNLGALDESPTSERGWNGTVWHDIVRGNMDETGDDPHAPGGQIPIRLRVGGIAELLDHIGRDYELQVSGGKLDGEAVWILAGSLRDAARDQIQRDSGRQQWPELCPTRVRVAIAATADEQTGFGAGIPIRLEFWSDPEPADAPGSSSPAEDQSPGGRLISLLELYSIQPIDRPSPARFKFINEEYAVHFVDETERYLERRAAESG